MRRCFRDRLLDYFYPARCPVCDKALAVGRDGICETCTAHIEYIREPKCCRCGKPLTEEDEFCNDCTGALPALRQVGPADRSRNADPGTGTPLAPPDKGI